jgi:hypothetical protein
MKCRDDTTHGLLAGFAGHFTGSPNSLRIGGYWKRVGFQGPIETGPAASQEPFSLRISITLRMLPRSSRGLPIACWRRSETCPREQLMSLGWSRSRRKTKLRVVRTSGMSVGTTTQKPYAAKKAGQIGRGIHGNQYPRYVPDENNDLELRNYITPVGCSR